LPAFEEGGFRILAISSSLSFLAIADGVPLCCNLLCRGRRWRSVSDNHAEELLPEYSVSRSESFAMVLLLFSGQLAMATPAEIHISGINGER